MSTDSLTPALRQHQAALAACRRCPKMASTPVQGLPVPSRILLVGQAPGVKEPVLQRPFAWTAGRTLFRWFEEALGWTETETRQRIYFSAVCRCFPGKGKVGSSGDRVPDETEIAQCSSWLDAEINLLRPRLLLPVGKLAIRQFLPVAKLNDWVGQEFTIERAGQSLLVIPLPHPSGASPWHRMEPGKTLLRQALRRVAVQIEAQGFDNAG